VGGRAQWHGCTLLEGDGGHRCRSCRSVRAPCGLCLGEPSCTPSCPHPQERPYNIGNKSCSGSNTNSPPMPSEPKQVTHRQQPPFSFSFFHLRQIACDIVRWRIISS